jgi:predicted Zn-dependent protease
LTLQTLSEIARKATRLATKKGADQVHATAFTFVEDLTRFANSQIHQNVATYRDGLRVRLVLKKKIGDALIGAFDPASIESVVSDAIKIAKVSPPNELFKSFPEPKKYSPLKGTFDKKTADCDPNLRADNAKRAIQVAHGKASFVKAVAGAYMTGSARFAVSDSLGVDAKAEISLAQMTVTVISEKEGSEGYGYYSAFSRDMKEIDVDKVAEKAADKSVKSVQPIRLEPGEYEALLAPDAVALSLSYVSSGFLGTWFQDGTSFVKYNLGKQVFHEKFNLKDNARDMTTLYVSPVDGEGVPRQALTLVKDGYVDEKSICYDSYTAGKEGKTSTGHAQLPFYEAFGPGPDLINMILAPGQVSEEEMIKETRRGIYVSRFHYVRTVNQPRMILTGLTRDGTFLIENGEITKPIRNFRFTDSFLDVYKGTQMIGKDQERQTQATVPPVKVSKLRFTGVCEQ